MPRSIDERIAEAEARVHPEYAAALRDLDEECLRVVLDVMARVERGFADVKAEVDEYQQAKRARHERAAFAAFVAWRIVFNPIEADIRAWARLALLHLERMGVRS